jgi:hypothetical protein
MWVTEVFGPRQQRGEMMDLETALKEAMQIDGAIGVALVDSESGMALGSLGGGRQLNLELAAAGNTEVVRSKMRTMQSLGLNDEIEDILITLGKQYHIIRPMPSRKGSALFMYLALDRSRGNLALARHTMKQLQADLTV